MSVARSFADTLVEKGVYEKASVVEEGACAVLALRRGDSLHLAALTRHEDWLYVKIAVGDAVPSYAWSCNNIFYTPYGVYAFSKSLEELVEKVARKQELLRAQEALVREVLNARGALE